MVLAPYCCAQLITSDPVPPMLNDALDGVHLTGAADVWSVQTTGLDPVMQELLTVAEPDERVAVPEQLFVKPNILPYVSYPCVR